ncbi:DegT/DnrJ/EryC1/StrS aminotransferase family protein [Lentimicrobium sp. S6]|uniref:DegT/DnrJ/EryC1/StrS family aminotransferase n=1 Tax=Lentimicrobium sp. S6 TaxID=2735872 RepID=UPI001553A384|nr:DegT/DnrJ/EryC1/StrS family aminotransferase [Lentimicrobium sp. S6]NPD46723.1 DegT/DnrJ/EryC1/StrS family aminotransferase [Lentimicrobium sp. S6]
MKIPFIDLNAQYESIKEEIDSAIRKTFETTSFVLGESVKAFEEDFSKAHDVKHCIAVGNGTDALVISLKVLGIGAGDEVIVPANSFIATSEAVSVVGARVSFVDNHPNTYNIDSNKIEKAISKNTKAIIVVHLYGQSADMDSILEIAKKYNLFVIEDSAQAHLSEYRSVDGGWRKVGSFGDIATFSFYPGKNLGAYGDAGAILTNNSSLAKKARMYANHGRVSKYDHEFEGINSRMDGIQGAVLKTKLKYLESWTNKRRKAAQYYLKKLNEIEGVSIPVVPETCNPVWHLFVIRCSNRDALKGYLTDNGISVGVHYPISLPNLKAYKYLSYNSNDFPVSSSYQKMLLSLPIFPEITQKQQDYVITAIEEFFKL